MGRIHGRNAKFRGMSVENVKDRPRERQARRLNDGDKELKKKTNFRMGR